MSILRAIKVEKQVENLGTPIDILKGVDLSVNEGESVAIVGTSGSGKTTLLSLLAGLDTPTKGEIYFQGESLHRLNEDERAKCRLGKVGFVFQNFDLLPHFNALENVMLPMELCGFSETKTKAFALLEKVGLTERRYHFPTQLSGGEQQRVAIARAFATEPKILFADEPTGNLDNETGRKVIELLFDLNQTMKTTLIIVTHDSVLSERCKHIYQLQGGKLTTLREAM